jgi:hypothetical protein
MKYEPINKASFLAGIDARIEAYRQANGIESVGVSLEQVTPDGHCRNCNKRHYIGNGTTQLECVDGNVCNPEKYNQVKQLWPSLSDRQIMREAGQFVCPNLTQNMRAEGLPEQKPFKKRRSQKRKRCSGILRPQIVRKNHNRLDSHFCANRYRQNTPHAQPSLCCWNAGPRRELQAIG